MIISSILSAVADNTSLVCPDALACLSTAVALTKAESAAEARILKLTMVRTLGVKDDEVFLDSDNLSDLADLIDAVKKSDCLVPALRNPRLALVSR